MPRAGRGRKKANTINYHGIVVTLPGGRNYLYNINSMFSNYVIQKKVTNVPDPLFRSAIHRALSYIIKKRREEITREKQELSTIPEKNVSVVKRFKKKIDMHEKMLKMFTNFSKFYHSSHHPNTKRAFNILKVNHNKKQENTGYRYFAVFPPKNPKKINA